MFASLRSGPGTHFTRPCNVLQRASIRPPGIIDNHMHQTQQNNHIISLFPPHWCDHPSEPHICHSHMYNSLENRLSVTTLRTPSSPSSWSPSFLVACCRSSVFPRGRDPSVSQACFSVPVCYIRPSVVCRKTERVGKPQGEIVAHRATRETHVFRYTELVVLGSSVVGADALSCLILAAAALALFPRKRFLMSSLEDGETLGE
jgi:hypothetical protein